MAATIPLSVPIYNDYNKARELGRMQRTMPPRVAAFASGDTLAMRTMVIGEIAGIGVAAILFL